MMAVVQFRRVLDRPHRLMPSHPLDRPLNMGSDDGIRIYPSICEKVIHPLHCSFVKGSLAARSHLASLPNLQPRESTAASAGHPPSWHLPVPH